MLDRKRVTFGLAFVLSIQSAVPIWAAERHLPDGTRIAVRLMEQLSSATTKDHDPVSFAVIEDVIVDGVVVRQGTPVRGVVVEAESKRRGAVAVFVPVAAPFFLLRKGKDVVVPEGTRIEAFVDGDHTIVTAVEKRTAVEKPGAALTNADVLALHRAGFGEQVRLAKIESSPAAFSVEATDLVALKKAGVSARVIAAMLAAK